MRLTSNFNMHVHTCVPIYTKERKQLRYSLAKFLKQTDKQTKIKKEKKKLRHLEGKCALLQRIRLDIKASSATFKARM